MNAQVFSSLRTGHVTSNFTSTLLWPSLAVRASQGLDATQASQHPQSRHLQSSTLVANPSASVPYPIDSFSPRPPRRRARRHPPLTTPAVAPAAARRVARTKSRVGRIGSDLLLEMDRLEEGEFGQSKNMKCLLFGLEQCLPFFVAKFSIDLCCRVFVG